MDQVQVGFFLTILYAASVRFFESYSLTINMVIFYYTFCFPTCIFIGSTIPPKLTHTNLSFIPPLITCITSSVLNSNYIALVTCRGVSISHGCMVLQIPLWQFLSHVSQCICKNAITLIWKGRPFFPPMREFYLIHLFLIL